MTYENKYPISKVLQKISTVLGLNPSQDSIPFPPRLFKKIMMTYEDIPPVISYPRTISQKYQDLMDCDFITDSDCPCLLVPVVLDYLGKYGGE